jgi:signal transduction histidine kinase
MEDPGPISNLLVMQPMPKLAEALLERKDRVVSRWNQLVKDHLPDADALTTAQVRNSIPVILDRMAAALEASNPRPTDELMEVTKMHGEVRFHESYNVKELIVEYRILRRVLVEEVDVAYSGTVSTREWIALDIAVDIALQQAVISFLEHQKTQLESSAEAQAKFLAFLSHDMRNSLNTIMLTMQWVEQSVQPFAELREEAESLRSSRKSAEDTISSMERLLQAERLRKGVEARRERIEVGKVAQAVVANCRASAEAKKLGLAVVAPATAEIQSDAGLLRVILENIIGNAIKYSDHGTITVAVKMIDDARGPGCELSISDEGAGIKPEQLATLFDAFKRGDTHGQPGVGLGLFIASQAARILGAQLGVRSTVGKGTTFSVVLRNLSAEMA